MPGDEAQKNVGDCRTSLLGTRSKGKALHESATNPKNKLPPGTATRFCGGVRYSVGQRKELLREVQAAEKGVEAGVGAQEAEPLDQTGTAGYRGAGVNLAVAVAV